MTKIKGICAALLLGSAVYAAAPAGAVTIDFTSAIDNSWGEGAATTKTLGGIQWSFDAANDPVIPRTPKAFFDEGIAGVGVCQRITVANECNNSSEDNVNGGSSGGVAYDEILKLTYDKAVSISNLFLTSDGHPTHPYKFVVAGGGTPLVDISLDGGANWISYVITNGTGAVVGFSTGLLAAGSSVWFRYNNDQFYLSRFDANVPVPAALPLLATGIAGLGYLSRRRKAK